MVGRENACKRNLCSRENSEFGSKIEKSRDVALLHLYFFTNLFLHFHQVINYQKDCFQKYQQSYQRHFFALVYNFYYRIFKFLTVAPVVP